MYQFDWSILLGESGRLLVRGAEVTIELAALALVLALILGFLFGVLRWSVIGLLKPICWLYVEFLRNTPPLVQILFWYFSATVVLPNSVILHCVTTASSLSRRHSRWASITAASSPRSCAVD
jgi:His/Glu/Gln/Arg/opine family amino acid ABC transporter permease subunit